MFEIASVFVWGENKHSQLGVENLEGVFSPIHVTSLDDIPVVDIAAGCLVSAVVTEAGKLMW